MKEMRWRKGVRRSKEKGMVNEVGRRVGRNKELGRNILSSPYCVQVFVMQSN
jgi:hypothetical protein